MSKGPMNTIIPTSIRATRTVTTTTQVHDEVVVSFLQSRSAPLPARHGTQASSEACSRAAVDAAFLVGLMGELAVFEWLR